MKNVEAILHCVLIFSFTYKRSFSRVLRRLMMSSIMKSLLYFSRIQLVISIVMSQSCVKEGGTLMGLRRSNSKASARDAAIDENLLAISLSISSFFLSVKLTYINQNITLQELMDGSMRNCSFLLRARQIGLPMSVSILLLLLYPVSQMYGLLSFSKRVEGKSRRQREMSRAARMEARQDYWPF